MTTTRITGIIFIISAVTPLLFYLGLGPEGADFIDITMTEKLVTWIMLGLPIAFMMTLGTMKGGQGYEIAKAGFLIMLISLAVGIVADSFNAVGTAEMNANGDAVGTFGWSSMMIGLTLTGIGYFLHKSFPQWVSGLLVIVGVYGFIFLGFLGSNDDIPEGAELPMWLGFTGVLLLLGIFTLIGKKSE